MTTRQPREEADVPENFYPQDGAIYRHWKGGLYRVLMVARVEATKDRVVVYAPFAGGMAWTRPIREFGARFSYVNNLGVDPREGLADRRVSDRGIFYRSNTHPDDTLEIGRTGSPDRRGGRWIMEQGMSTGESPRDFAADLRALAKDDTLTPGGNWCGFFEATADEIERLRDSVRRLARDKELLERWPRVADRIRMDAIMQRDICCERGEGVLAEKYAGEARLIEAIYRGVSG